jgi:hypothetical protein
MIDGPRAVPDDSSQQHKNPGEIVMPNAPMRAFLGFIAAAIAVLTFHQGMVEALHALGWSPFTPYRTTPVPPFGVPVIVSNCFWGGMYGVAFGLAMPRFTWPMWLCGLLLGLIAVLVGWFIVAPLKYLPIAGGWVPAAMLRSLAINGFWGLGVGIILPLLMPRALVRVHP